MTPDPLANDLDLVDQARDGSKDAVVELWVRHYPAALAAARRTARQPRDAEELASDAFSNMLGALGSGGGPTGSVRAYLLTSVRNLAVTRSRRGSSSEVLSDDVAIYEDGSRALADPMSRQTEISMMRQAFAALPRRWQVILWRTAVDHDRNIEIGQDLGISPNAVAALSKRARRGLRQAYLQVHLSTNGVDPACEPFVRRLPLLAIEGAEPADDLARHLRTCATCPGRLAELLRVEQQLGALLLPAVLLTSPAFLSPALAGSLAASATAAAPAASAVGLAGAAPGTAAAASAPGATSALVAKLGAAKMALIGVGAAAAVSAGVLVAHQDGSRPVAQVVRTSTPSATSAPRVTPSRAPTSTAPTVSTPRPAQPAQPPPTSRQSVPTPRSTTRTRVPRPTPPPTPSSTSRPVEATPLGVGMGISGPPEATEIRVDARSQGTTGGPRLMLRVPAGVELVRASGDWASCEQSGWVISCTARPAPERWSGTLVTGWADGAAGTVTAEVTTTYRDGGSGAASASATWPP